MRKTGSILAAAAVLAAFLLPAAPARARSVCDHLPFGRLLACLQGLAAAKEPLTVTLEGPLEVEPPQGRSWADASKVFADNRLVVAVPPGRPLDDEGGKALFILADFHLVDPATKIGKLRPETKDLLIDQDECGKFCRFLAEADRTGQELLDKGHASNLNDFSVKAGPEPVKTEAAPPTGTPEDERQEQDSPLAWWAKFLLVLLALLTLALLLLTWDRFRQRFLPDVEADRYAGRRRQPAELRQPQPVGRQGGAAYGERHATGGQRIPPAAPTRPDPVPPPVQPPPGHVAAEVRTELDPQGYVELDGELHRVEWGAPGEPPLPGEFVLVPAQEQGRIRQALPFGSPGQRS